MRYRERAEHLVEDCNWEEKCLAVKLADHYADVLTDVAVSGASVRIGNLPGDVLLSDVADARLYRWLRNCLNSYDLHE